MVEHSFLFYLVMEQNCLQHEQHSLLDHALDEGSALYRSTLAEPVHRSFAVYSCYRPHVRYERPGLSNIV